MQIRKFDNQMMHSNCYIIVDDAAEHCIIVDPASEKSLNEIQFIKDNHLELDYIFLTHEHTDHTWGVNSLIDAFPNVKVIATQACKDELPKADQAYFRLYYDDPDYRYIVRKVDITTEDIGWELVWQGHKIVFLSTPGHSIGSMCFSIGDYLFTGDTIMQVKKMYINKKSGSWEKWKKSEELINNKYNSDTTIYPGHGDKFHLKEYKCVQV